MKQTLAGSTKQRRGVSITAEASTGKGIRYLGDSRLLLITGKGADQVVNQQRQLEGVRSIITHPQPTHKGYILVFTQGWQGRLGSHICKAECLQCTNLLCQHLLCRLAAYLLEVSLISGWPVSKNQFFQKAQAKVQSYKDIGHTYLARLACKLHSGWVSVDTSQHSGASPSPPTHAHTCVHASN